MPYDFDTPVERHGTDCLKFDFAEARHRSPDLLSLWVADMDFPTAPEILDAIAARTQHGIFGYTMPTDGYFKALDNWCSRRYGWHVPAEQVTITPGVVYALAAAVRAFTQPGDAVLIQQPVYYPFGSVITNNGRKLVNTPLVFENNAYSIDFDAFEQAITENKVKLFLLCNPHNPGGRVWSTAELTKLGEICVQHDVIIVSDEIHMDFARPGHKHTPFLTLDENIAQHAIACTSASKTFNLAGLQIANTVIPNEDLRRTYRQAVEATGFFEGNTLGLVATQAAYEHGEQWLTELKTYLEDNWKLVADTLAQRTPQLTLIDSGSTYLAWIDCRALGLYGSKLQRFIEDEAGLWLDCGDMFGKEGDGFIRINLATQRTYLARALNQLATAVEHLS